MIRRRSVSDSAPHDAISFSVRPQPMQSPVAPSTAQTLTQGEEIGAVTFLFTRKPSPGFCKRSLKFHIVFR
jgi:hypothetical protein